VYKIKIMKNTYFVLVCFLSFNPILLSTSFIEDAGGEDIPHAVDHSSDPYADLTDTSDEYESIWDPLGERKDRLEREKQQLPKECESNDVIVKLNNELKSCRLLQEASSNFGGPLIVDNVRYANHNENSDLPYFKHLLDKLNDLMNPHEEDTEYIIFQGIMKRSEYVLLQKAMKDENSNNKLILDLFSVIKPNRLWKIYTSQITWPAVIATLGCFISILLLLFCQRQFYHNASTLKHVCWMFFFAFIVSIPWEWYRMYKNALADKAAKSMGGMPAECMRQNLTAWSSLGLWFRDTFTFSDDACTQYHKNILVDPIWEISPFQAAAVCSSRLFTEISRQFASALGASISLFLKELPSQWQPIALILCIFTFIMIVMILSGFEISTPLLSLGVRPHKAVLQEKDKQILRLQQEKNKLVNEKHELNYQITHPTNTTTHNFAIKDRSPKKRSLKLRKHSDNYKQRSYFESESESDSVETLHIRNIDEESVRHKSKRSAKTKHEPTRDNREDVVSISGLGRGHFSATMPRTTRRNANERPEDHTSESFIEDVHSLNFNALSINPQDNSSNDVDMTSEERRLINTKIPVEMGYHGELSPPNTQTPLTANTQTPNNDYVMVNSDPMT